MKSSTVRLTLAVASTIVACSSVHATTWHRAALSGPPARNAQALVYDSRRAVTVMFGGRYLFSETFFSDTWEWDGSRWLQVATDGPPARTRAFFAYDSLRGVTVLFGGHGPDAILADTWEWDGSRWLQVASDGPSPRQGSQMAFDSRRGVTVLYGGKSEDDTLFAETWEWDGAAWSRVETDGSPPPMSNFGMAYDRGRGLVVLFGGAQASTWEYDGSSWRLRALGGPARRDTHALAYDTARERIVMFGGWNQDLSEPRFFGDTWEWDGRDWVVTATTGPRSRDGLGLVYDSRRRTIVLFGGRLYTHAWGDTWEYRAPALRAEPFVPGEPLRMRVDGNAPGDIVWVLRSERGRVPGPCYGQLGGACVDLAPPLRLAGPAVADADGVARLAVEVPAEPGADVVFLQAAVPDAEASLLSQPVQVEPR